MLYGVVLAFLTAGIGQIAAGADGNPPIPADQARNHVGKKITVRMTVKASKKSAKRKLVFLDSSENFQDPDNLGIAIQEAAERDLAQQHQTDDLAGFFRGKTIHVTGTVMRREERTYIDVDAAGQITLPGTVP